MEVALDKLRSARARLPADEQSPDLVNLTEALEGLEGAEAELRQASEGGVQATDARVFKALVGLLKCMVQCVSSTRVLFGSSRLPRLLQASSLQPVMGPETVDGRVQYVVRVPSEGVGALRPDSAIKLLLAAIEVGRTGDATQLAQALKLLQVVFLALWFEADVPVKRQLAAQRRVPAWPQAERHQQLAPQAAAATMPPARALAAALAEHCPGVTLGDVHRWALQLRVALSSLESGAGSSSTAEGHQRDLCDAQQLFSGGSAGGSGVTGFYVAVRAFDVLLVSDSWAGGDRARRDRAQAFVDASIERALAARRWLPVAELIQRKLRRFVLPRNAGRYTQQQRHAAREEARRLLMQSKDCLRALKPWLPSRFGEDVASTQKRLEAELQALDHGPGRTAAPPPAPSALVPPCSGCGTNNALHLRKCRQCKTSSYCSRACQVKHWKEGGHKAECARLAAEHASGGATHG